MGNTQGVFGSEYARPEQFVTQAHSDWEKQIKQLYQSRSTFTKTVILPPGVALDDPRLVEGTVVSERKYTLPAGVFPDWPEESPFECDVDGRLLPPCWGSKNTHAHYAVYPDSCFKELNCSLCTLHQSAHSPELIVPIGFSKKTQLSDASPASPQDDEFLEPMSD